MTDTVTLKEYTADAHAEAEGTLLMDYMMAGTVLRDSWNELLAQKQAIAEAIDAKLNLPESIAMGSLIAADNTEGFAVLPSTQEYVDMITNGSTEDALADLYVNYLGDMYGGRYLAKSIPFENKTHLQVENLEERINYIRAQLEGKDSVLKDRALLAFRTITSIYYDIVPRY